MKNVRFSISLFLIISVAILLSDTNLLLSQDNKEFSTVKYSQIQIMSCQDMVLLTGGTAGGSGLCKPYTASCGGCIPMSAYKCQGSSGSCTNNCHMAVCYCGTYFIFTHGCLY